MLFTELGLKVMNMNLVLNTLKLKYLGDSHEMSNTQLDMQGKALLEI